MLRREVLTTFAKKVHRERLKFIRASNPNVWFPMLLTTFILFVVVLFLASYSLQRAEFGIGTKMANSGMRAILLYEAITKGKIKLDENHNYEDLITSLNGEFSYVFFAITDHEGNFIAHSNQEKIGDSIYIEDLDGEVFDFSEHINFLLTNRTSGTDWDFVQIDDTEFFIIHRILDLGNPNDKEKSHIFVALDPILIQQEVAFYRESIIKTSLWIFGLGVASFWTFLMVFRAYIGRKRMSVASDIIEDMQKEMEWLKTEVQKHEKLTAMSTLAAGVAHELRNPLSSIKGYATYFSNQFPKGSTSNEVAHIMIDEVERLNRVIKDLINVAQPIALEKKVVSLHSIINSTIALLMQDANTLGISLILTGKDRMVFADVDRLKQAFLNILLNAIEAFKEDDYIKAMTDKAYIKVHLAEGPGMIKIQIKNNASPIDPKDIKRIFDPYFTTKSNGTGLGLLITTKIIESHDGSIAAQSHKDIGTLFTVQLPKIIKE